MGTHLALIVGVIAFRPLVLADLRGRALAWWRRGEGGVP